MAKGRTPGGREGDGGSWKTIAKECGWVIVVLAVVYKKYKHEASERLYEHTQSERNGKIKEVEGINE